MEQGADLTQMTSYGTGLCNMTSALDWITRTRHARYGTGPRTSSFDDLALQRLANSQAQGPSAFASSHRIAITCFLMRRLRRLYAVYSKLAACSVGLAEWLVRWLQRYFGTMSGWQHIVIFWRHFIRQQPALRLTQVSPVLRIARPHCKKRFSCLIPH